MKYMKAIDVWTYSDAIRSGQIRLQKGQWLRLGPNGTLSRYHHSNGSNITAFHYPNATQKFRQYEKSYKEIKKILDSKDKV